MAGIFVSYRRSDAGDHAARIADRLRLAFGPPRVFLDRTTESLAPGVDFPVEIDNRVATCEVLLVVIGSGWMVTNPGHVASTLVRCRRLHPP